MDLKELGLYCFLGIATATGLYGTAVQNINMRNRNLASDVSKIISEKGTLNMTMRGKYFTTHREMEIGNLLISVNDNSIEVVIKQFLEGKEEDMVWISDYVDKEKNGNINTAEEDYVTNRNIEQHIMNYEQEEYIPFYPEQSEYIWILNMIQKNNLFAIENRYKDIELPKEKPAPKGFYTI